MKNGYKGLAVILAIIFSFYYHNNKKEIEELQNKIANQQAKIADLQLENGELVQAIKYQSEEGRLCSALMSSKTDYEACLREALKTVSK